MVFIYPVEHGFNAGLGREMFSFINDTKRPAIIIGITNYERRVVKVYTHGFGKIFKKNEIAIACSDNNFGSAITILVNYIQSAVNDVEFIWKDVKSLTEMHESMINPHISPDTDSRYDNYELISDIGKIPMQELALDMSEIMQFQKVENDNKYGIFFIRKNQTEFDRYYDDKDKRDADFKELLIQATNFAKI